MKHNTFLELSCLFLLIVVISLAAQNSFSQQAPAEVKVAEVKILGDSRSIEVSVEETNPVEARSKLMEQAAEKVAMSMITDLIGEAKIQKNKAIIQTRVLKQSGRFLPSAKVGDLAGDGVSFKTTVTFKTQSKELEKILGEQGLLADSDVLLSAVMFINTDKAIMDSFEALAQEELLAGQIYLTPFYRAKWNQVLPSGWDLQNLNLDQKRVILNQLRGNLWIETSLTYDKIPGQNVKGWMIDSKAIQASNNKVLAQVKKQQAAKAQDQSWKELSKKGFKELSMQILEIWQRGALGASTVRIGFSPRPTLQQQEDLKNFLKSNIKEIKGVRERLISSKEIVFEVDYSGQIQALGPKISALQFQGQSILLESTTEQEVRFQIK